MNHLTRDETVGAGRFTVLNLEKVRIRQRFQQEQKKLEDMIAARFQNGNHNMGADLCILKQSTLLDKLIVDEMMLDEMSDRYHKDQL